MGQRMVSSLDVLFAQPFILRRRKF